MGCFIPHRRQGWLPWVKQTGPLLLCDPFGDGSCIAAANDGTGLDCHTTKDLNKCGDPHLIYTNWGYSKPGIGEFPGFDLSECDEIYCELTGFASMTVWVKPYTASAGAPSGLMTTVGHSFFTHKNFDNTGIYFCYTNSNWEEDQILCTISFNIWYFVYISFIDGKIYVRSQDNNTLATTADSFIDNTMSEVIFVGNSDLASVVDQIRFFNRSLSEAECERLFFEYGDVA